MTGKSNNPDVLGITVESDGFILAGYHNMIVHSINDVIGVSSKNRGILYLSPSIVKETGWQMEEFANKSIFHFAHEDDLPIINNALKLLELEDEVVFEWRSKTKSGRYGWVETTIKNVYKPGDEDIYRVFSCRNIQLRKEMEEQLIKTTEELTNVNRMKDKFFSLIAHDLKNPMFSLMTLTEFIKQQLPGMTPEDYLDFINQINDAAKNSFILLENLLEWAKSQTGRMEFRPEPVNIGQVVADNWKLAKNQALSKNISFDIAVQQDLYAVVDYKMLSTIIRNLLSNAIKYTPDHGKIIIQACFEANTLIMSIEDTGIGMSREQLKYLFTFDPRKQLNGEPVKHGTGIGLVLCKEFIEKHGGTIAVTSKIGAGSRFVLSIPQSIS